MKKALSLAILLLGCIGIFAETVEVDGIYYEINTSNHTAMVTRGESKYSDDIVIPEYIIYNNRTFNVTSIRTYAFGNCTGLTSITIPQSVTSIEENAFWGCTGLTKVNFTDLAAWCEISFGSNPLSYAHHLYLNDKEITDLVIPDSVTSIGAKAFMNCTGITSVTIPNSVTRIGNKVFQSCTGLSSISIPNSVTSIGENAFWGCTGLTSITIPNSVTSIGGYAFQDCRTLTSVTIGNSVASIGDYTFGGCIALNSITIPNSVTSIGKYAFQYCTGLTSITIGNSVTSIGEKAFYGCTGLTSITIPNSVTSLGKSAFTGCSGLTSLTIGSSVTSIGENAFKSCSNIETVVSLNPSPPYYYASSSDGSLFPSEVYFGTLYVPIGSESAYRNKDGWKNFYEIIEGTPDGIKVQVTIAASQGGSVSFLDKKISNGSASVDVEPDTEVTLSIAPDEGYRFVSLVVNGNDVTEDVVDGTYTIKEINEATSAVATFEDKSVRRAKMDNNDDGEVNSADVVNIYNYIITGE